MSLDARIVVIDGGFAGCEAAWQAARRGAAVALYEMKPVRVSPAHHSPDLAEVVCSNSLGSDNPESAPGLLKRELRALDSVALAAADRHRVPAGEALAVDRELLAAEKVPSKPFEEEKIFEGCMPIEVMAARGPMTLAFGPLKPVGLVDPRTGKRPFAVVQLRQEDAAASLYNMVGFQTKLKYPEQKRVFRMIPGLEQAEFVRLGSLHRNVFLNAPCLIDEALRVTRAPSLFLAGQMIGVEGYVESCAMGALTGIHAARLVRGEAPLPPPRATAFGALVHYLVASDPRHFQPMNVNFGLLPEPPPEAKVKKDQRRAWQLARAAETLAGWLSVSS